MFFNTSLAFFLILQLCSLNASCGRDDGKFENPPTSFTLKYFVWDKKPFVNAIPCVTWMSLVENSQFPPQNIQEVIKQFRFEEKTILAISNDPAIQYSGCDKSGVIRAILYVHFELYGFTAMDVVMMDVSRSGEVKKNLRKRRGSKLKEIKHENRGPSRQHLIEKAATVSQITVPTSQTQESLADFLKCAEVLDDSPLASPLACSYSINDACDKEVAEINAAAIKRDGYPFGSMLDQ